MSSLRAAIRCLIGSPSRAVAGITGAMLVLGLCGNATAAALLVSDSVVDLSEDSICQPQIWEPNFPDVWNGSWECLQSSEVYTRFSQPSATAFELESYLDVGTLLAGESWLERDYTHTMRLSLAGREGESAKAWLYAGVEGLLSASAIGGGIGNGRGGASISIWQGEFDEWDHDGSSLSPAKNGEYPERPDFSKFWSESVFATILWFPDKEIDSIFHEILDFDLVAGDPNTDLWVRSELWAYADSVAITGTGEATIDFYHNDRGFRYGFSLDDAPPAGWESSGTEVPEPATIALIGLGLAGLGLTRRRRQQD